MTGVRVFQWSKYVFGLRLVDYGCLSKRRQASDAARLMDYEALVEDIRKVLKLLDEELGS